MRMASVLVLPFFLSACDEQAIYYPDRKLAPEYAFEQLKLASEKKDMAGLLDAMADSAVLDLLRNSLFLCFGHSDPLTRPQPPKSPGCEVVVAAHRFPLAGVTSVRATDDEFLVALRSVPDVRAFAAELETYIQEFGEGSSFVWGHMNEVTLSNLRVSGSTAYAEAKSPHGEHPVEFYLVESGWRVEMWPTSRSEAIKRWRE